jgi:exodeoxyribonuclease-3
MGIRRRRGQTCGDVKIATWNVNGIRARGEQVLEWLDRERPDVVCLQEIKAPTDLVPTSLSQSSSYFCRWHGHKGYSGVALLVRRDAFAASPEFSHPDFDDEARIVTASTGDFVFASVYVPNGGKDFGAKMRFLEALDRFTWEAQLAGRLLVLCGDLNVARAPIDVHPRERKLGIGQLPEERELIESILSHGLVDLGRAFAPDDDGLFTWWAPWRNMRERNIGWRLDYVMVSDALATRASGCVVQKAVGTSDHAPVLATFA